jgi:hypothetical protein
MKHSPGPYAPPKDVMASGDFNPSIGIKNVDITILCLAAGMFSTSWFFYPSWEIASVQIYNPFPPVGALMFIGWIALALIRGRWKMVLLVFAFLVLLLAVAVAARGAVSDETGLSSDNLGVTGVFDVVVLAEL